MENAKPMMSVNRTCNTMFGGVLIFSVLIASNDIVPIKRSNFQALDMKVIQTNSEKTCKTYTLKNGISYFLPGYNMYETLNPGIENVVIDEEKMCNLKKLDQIAVLKDGWNGNKAKAFEPELISKVRSVITSLQIQPEVFPTACNSIQIEYEKEDGSYLEINLCLADTWEVFEISREGEETYTSITADSDAVKKVVNTFYG